MSEFKVQVQRLHSIMDSTEQLESVLRQAAAGVMSVKRDLRAQIRQRERIDSRLITTAQLLETQGQAVSRVVSVGRQTAKLYQETEQMLLGAQFNKPAGKEEPDGLINDEILWKVVGEAGVVGSVIKATASFASGDGFGGVKDITKLVGGAGKLAEKGSEAGWKDLLGFTTRPSAPETFGKSLAAQANKYNFGKAKSAGGRVAVAAKWAGDFITVLETGKSNLEEYKDKGGWSNPRMYSETAMESTLKIGSGFLIGAAVMAVTPVGWTTFAVGAATVVTTAVANWALDGLSGLITGNSDGWVENLSDTLLNLEEGAKKFVGNAAKKVGQGAKKAVKSVAKWWGSLWN